MKSYLLSTCTLVALATQSIAADEPKLVHRFRMDALVNWIVITPDGKTLLAGGQKVDIDAADGYEVRAWDLSTGKLSAGPVRTKKGKASCGTVSPDGKLLLTGGTLGRWHLWSLPDLKPVGEGFVGLARVHRVAFAPDGKTFATLNTNYIKRLTDPLRESRVTYTVRTFETATREPVGNVATWPRERLAGEAATLPRMHEPAGWTRYGRPQFGKYGRPVPPEEAACVSLAPPDEPASYGGPMATEFDPDRKQAVSGGVNGEVIVWEFPARKVIGKPLATFRYLSIYEGGIIISPDGHRVAVVGSAGDGDDRPAVTVFDLDKRSVVAGPFRPTPIVSNELLSGMAFTPDGTILAVAGRQRDEKSDKLSGLIEVWKLAGK